jgi:hypothetical protein
MIELTYVQGSLDPDASTRVLGISRVDLDSRSAGRQLGGGGKVIYYADVKGLTTDGAWAAS